MKIAIHTLTRDRLDYTKHCFARLWEFAGCDFDHWILDNASSDDTVAWIEEEYEPAHRGSVYYTAMDENLGIGEGLNTLLDACSVLHEYDVIVHFDNDCELVMPNTIRDTARLAFEGGCLLSPRILGLKNPPAATRELRIGDETILDVPQIGGICLTAPAWVFDDFAYPDTLPKWGGDDATLCAWFRNQGGTVGYVKRLEAWHYETTAGQEARYPDYFLRKSLEFSSDGR